MPCPQRKACPYENWAASGDWLFASHARLVLENKDPQLFKDRSIVVIDESPLTSMLAGVTFTDPQVREAVGLLRGTQPVGSKNHARDAFVLLFETASALLQSPPANRQRVALRDLVVDLGFQFVRRVISSKHFETAQYKDPTRRTVDPGAVRSFLKTARLPKKLTEKLHQLADALSDDDRDRPATVLFLGTSGSAGGIVAGHFKPLPIPPSLPVVILDATADSMLLELALGRPVITLDVEVEQASTIQQTYDHRYPASILLDPKGTAIKRIVACIEKYKTDNPSHRIGVVMKKTVFEDATVNALVTKVVATADVRFFWSLRGDNAMEDFDAVYVIGAPELQSLDAEARVRAFMSRIPYAAGDGRCSYEATSLPIESALIVSAGRTRLRSLVDRWGDDVVLEERGFGMNFESLVYPWRSPESSGRGNTRGKSRGRRRGCTARRPSG